MEALITGANKAGIGQPTTEHEPGVGPGGRTKCVIPPATSVLDRATRSTERGLVAPRTLPVTPLITSPTDHLFRLSDPVYNAAEAFWKDARTQRRLGNLLVWGFVGALLLIELNRCSALPPELGAHVPTNHFYAVGMAFSVLLGFEILGLAFVLPESVSDSLGKQFEILSIILLRESFQEFVHFDEPIRWERVAGALLPIFVNAFGGLLTFVTIGFFYRFQRHRRITAGLAEQERFRATKRLLAIVLLVFFIGIGARDARAWVRGDPSGNFFDTFFTVLVFSDILIIFLLVRYNSTYQIVFRNSGFALATVFIRLSVTAPAYYNSAIAVGSALFAITLTLAYNAFAPTPVAIREEAPGAED